MQAVLDANPGVANLTELANAATSRLSQTQAGFLPLITGTATYTHLTPVSRAAFGAAGATVCTQQQLRRAHYGAVRAAGLWQAKRYHATCRARRCRRPRTT
ncbi:MAG: hypothetical protein WKG07_23585 [Hymenobacter sp.]